MAVALNYIRPILWPCPAGTRTGLGTLPSDWFEGDSLILWVNPSEYRRVVDRPSDAKAFTDTGAGTVSAVWTARVGFDVTITDGDARKLFMVQRSISSGGGTLTVLDYVRPEVADVISSQGYTARTGRVEAIEEKGGMVQDADGILYCQGFDIRFRESARRLTNL